MTSATIASLPIRGRRIAHVLPVPRRLAVHRALSPIRQQRQLALLVRVRVVRLVTARAKARVVPPAMARVAPVAVVVAVDAAVAAAVVAAAVPALRRNRPTLR